MGGEEKAVQSLRCVKIVYRKVTKTFPPASFFSPAGSLHEGDEIAEINGRSVTNQSVDQLQKILVSLMPFD